MKKIIYLYALVSLLGLGFQSCSDNSGNDDEEPLPTTPTVVLPSIKGVDGYLACIRTITKSNGVSVTNGTAFGGFIKSGTSEFLDAGNVSVNNTALTKGSDNRYFYTAAGNGLVYSAQTYWKVSGNATNGIAAIDDNTSPGFPNIPNISESIIIDATETYTLSWGNLNGSDSVIVILRGPSGSIKRQFEGTKANTAYLPADLTVLGKGSGSVQVIGFKAENKVFGGKTIKMIRESVANGTSVNIQ